MKVNKESEKPEALKILRILLIEDNEHDVLAFRRAFKKNAVACEITSCSRAEEGLQRYYTEPLSFDLIVIDQGLPGISGFEMCRKLLRKGISIPMVILTGMGSTELAVKALKAGVNDYIIKDPDRGYIDLLPTVLSEVMKRHNERLSHKKAEEKILLHSEILKNMAEGVCLIRASDAVIVYANEKFEKMFGYGPGELNQKPVTVVNYEDKNIDAEQVRDGIIKKLSQYGEATYEVRNVKKDGTPFWCVAHTSTINHSKYGQVWVAVHSDVTERKQAEEKVKASLREKEVLLKEIHHRVKNNMTVISSLLKLQANKVKDNRSREMFIDNIGRIKSMAMIQDKLYRTEDLARVDFKSYLKEMITSMFTSYRLSPDKIALHTNIENISINIDDAIPFGLIINELISNSLKHAFPEDRKGNISIVLCENENNEIELTVSDDGVGMPERLDFKKTDSLGLNLVNTLIRQLQGEIELNKEKGTEFRITFGTSN